MDEKGRKALWRDYIQTRTPQLREKLIIEYVGLVRVVAGRMGMYLGHTVEFDDLNSYGVFGLIDAIDKFELTKGVKFETYASLRIRGAILDQIRKMDWIPRSLRQKQKQLEQASSEFDTKFGRAPTQQELASYLKISEDELEDLQNQTQLSSLISLEEYMGQGSEIQNEPEKQQGFIQPETAMEQKELKQLLAQAISSLTEKEQKVIALYYYDELTLKEISQILEVSESRISQLHTKALKKMKQKLGEKNMGVFGIWDI
jgi:RNA polymerase sigma factor for flagellar operon FliA